MKGRVYPVNREGSGGSNLGGNLPEVMLAKKQGQEVIQDGKSVKPRAGRGHGASPLQGLQLWPNPLLRPCSSSRTERGALGSQVSSKRPCCQGKCLARCPHVPPLNKQACCVGTFSYEAFMGTWGAAVGISPQAWAGRAERGLPPCPQPLPQQGTSS